MLSCWILVIGPGSVGKAVCTGPRVTSDPQRSRAARIVGTATPPTRIPFLMSIHQASTPKDSVLIGSRVKHRGEFFVVFDSRVGLPPMVVANCVAQSIELLVVGHRRGSLTPLVETLCVCGP